MRRLMNLLSDDDGATAVEYAVMLGLIIVACVVIVSQIGLNTKELLDPGGALNTALAGSSSS